MFSRSITKANLATLLGVTDQTVRNWIREGILPPPDSDGHWPADLLQRTIRQALRTRSSVLQAIGQTTNQE